MNICKDYNLRIYLYVLKVLKYVWELLNFKIMISDYVRGGEKLGIVIREGNSRGMKCIYDFLFF